MIPTLYIYKGGQKCFLWHTRTDRQIVPATAIVVNNIDLT